MDKNTDQLQRVDELLEQGRERRALEQAINQFRKQMERHPWQGLFLILLGFLTGTFAFFSGLFTTIDGKHVLLAGGIPPLVTSLCFFYAGGTLLWKKPADRLLLELVEKSLREQQPKS